MLPGAPCFLPTPPPVMPQTWEDMTYQHVYGYVEMQAYDRKWKITNDVQEFRCEGVDVYKHVVHMHGVRNGCPAPVRAPHAVYPNKEQGKEGLLLRSLAVQFGDESTLLVPLYFWTSRCTQQG